MSSQFTPGEFIQLELMPREVKAARITRLRRIYTDNGLAIPANIQSVIDKLEARP